MNVCFLKLLLETKSLKRIKFILEDKGQHSFDEVCQIALGFSFIFLSFSKGYCRLLFLIKMKSIPKMFIADVDLLLPTVFIDK